MFDGADHPQRILAEATREGGLSEDRRKHYRERLARALLRDTAGAMNLAARKETDAPEDPATILKREDA